MPSRLSRSPDSSVSNEPLAPEASGAELSSSEQLDQLEDLVTHRGVDLLERYDLPYSQAEADFWAHGSEKKGARPDDRDESALQAKLSLLDVGNRAYFARLNQTEGVGETAGNGNRICGGAAVVNALILSSDTPEKLAANARALGDAARAVRAEEYLPPSISKQEVERALAAFSSGQMTEHGVQVLQELAYATLRVYTGDGRDRGANAAAMGLLVGQLGANGADLSDSVFTLTSNKSTHNAHWTVIAKGVLADSLGAAHQPEKGDVWTAEVTPARQRGEGVVLRMRRDELPEAKGPPKKGEHPDDRMEVELPATLTLPGGHPNVSDAGQLIRERTVKAP